MNYIRCKSGFAIFVAYFKTLMTDTIKKTGFRWGLWAGLSLILLSTYIHFYHLELLTDVWVGVLTLLMTVVFGIVSILVVKKKLGGQIDFKEAFSAYFVTILIASLLSTVYLLLLYHFILSPETRDSIRQAMIDFNLNLMQQNLASQEDKDKAMEVYKTFDPFAPAQVLTAALKYLMRDCLIGFLVALIFRNKRTL